MKRQDVTNGRLKTVFDAGAIAAKVDELAERINEQYRDRPLVVVCVLKGAYLFFADLVRRLTVSPEVDFVRLCSYGDATCSSGQVRMILDMDTSVQGKHVLVVDDVVDTGLSLDFLCRELAARGPLTVRTCILVDKVERRKVDLKVDFPGFHLTKGYIVGYGMDLAGKYRELDSIYEYVS